MGKAVKMKWAAANNHVFIRTRIEFFDKQVDGKKCDEKLNIKSCNVVRNG